MDGDQNYKIAMVGEHDVGKTSILKVLQDPTFFDIHLNEPTIGQKCFTYQSDNYKTKFSIWDTCGQEKYRSLTPITFRGCDGVILVFDITSKRTFDCLPEFITLIHDFCSQNCKLFLVGNKYDLKERRCVSYIEAENFRKEIKAESYIETSALTHENIDHLFHIISSQFQRNPPAREKIQISQSNENSSQSSKSSCFCKL